LNEEKEIPIKRNRINDPLIAEGLRWRQHETSLANVPIRSSPKKVIEILYTASPEGRIFVCLDEMRPESAKSFAGQQLVHAQATAA
jgi:hypothetical protein